MNAPHPPFSCSYSPNIPELLLQLNCTLAITTYQAGKVVFISPKDDNKLVQLPRTFRHAMGITFQDDKLAIAAKDEVIILKNSPDLARFYPKKPGYYDALFMPRSKYFTGHVDIHDLHWGNAGLWAVNTSFSCFCLIDEEHSFTPVWQPSFISALASEDRCHLNGLAMEEGEPVYATALGSGNEPGSWRKDISKGGVMIEINSGDIIAEGLPMPHSPRIYDGKAYLLCSATGELLQIDRNNGKQQPVYRFDSFVRGMAKHGDYLFIGTSKLRKNSSAFRDLDIAKNSSHAGIYVLHLPTASLFGQIRYHASVDEIYDVQVIPGIQRPGILNTDSDTYKLGLSIPGATYWAREKGEKEG